MATLENIRKRGPLVSIIIGLALLAFILGDLINNGQKLMSGSRSRVAEVKGESISIQELQERINNLVNIYEIQTGQSSLDERTTKGIRDQIWNQTVREYVLKDSYSDLGIGVTSEELVEMVRGTNISADPMIQQIFTDKETGKFNPTQAIEFFRNLDRDPKAKTFGLYLEKEMQSNRMFTKYATLISKGINVTDLEARDAFKERMEMVDIKYVVKQYNTVSDSSLTVSDDDISDYYKKHKKDFDQKYTRDIAYITYDVIPSQEDQQFAQTYVTKIKSDFAKTTDNEVFVNRNSDSPFDQKHYAKGGLKNKNLDSLMFSSEVGTVYGPYLEDGSYKLAKLVSESELPDTVGVRHILLQVDGKKIKDNDQAKKVADSIKAALKNKEDFGKLAEKYSADSQNNKKGGVLDKFAEGGSGLGSKFEDACFSGEKGDVQIVETQFGVDVVEITYQTAKVKKIQAAVIERKIVPGKKTYAEIYNKANKFAAENTTAEQFENTVKKEGLTRKVVTDLEPMTDVIAGIGSPRQIIQWVFNEDNKKGAVSGIFESDDRFIIAVITQIKPKGIAPLEQVKDIISAIVKKQKKGEKFAAEFKKDLAGGKSLDQLGMNIIEAKNLSFSSGRLPQGGNEPAVIATAVKTGKDKISAPVIGENGVYVLDVTSITGIADLKTADVKADRTNLVQRNQFRAQREAYEALKDKANVVDQREKFF
jgi:peptidyl-prolyl cis-trans isomerase D